MLLQKLIKLAKSDIYPMHMPGHKRSKCFQAPHIPFEIDITEIDEFDDLHNPKGILADMAALAEELYKSKKAFSLINGSTAGIFTAIGAHTQRGDRILITRNCHWSVENAAELFGLRPIFIEPTVDNATGIPLSVSPALIESALKRHEDIKLLVVTSPSYEGVVCDIRLIAEIAHSHNVCVFVDQAHGAHLGFSDDFPLSAIQCGADIVVMSLHKTLPALTQCSLLHACSEKANVAEMSRLLSFFQTSSPSYVLMASIDYCLHLLKNNGIELFSEYSRRLASFSQQISGIKNLSVLHHDCKAMPNGIFAYDKSKIVVCGKNSGLSGQEITELLRRNHKIEPEKPVEDYVIAMTSICDTDIGFARLAAALKSIDSL